MKTATTNKPAVKDRISESKQVTSPVAATSKKVEYVKPVVEKKETKKVDIQEIKKEVPSKPVIKSTETKVEMPTKTVTGKKPAHVTTIEQARNVLKGRNVVPQEESKVYKVAEHRGFLENNAEIINTIGNIGAMVLTGSSFKNTSNLNRLGSRANPNRNVGGYTPSREPISTVRETPINRAADVAKSAKGVTGKTIQQERVASRTIAGKRLPKKHQDGGSIDFLTSIIEQFKRCW